MKKNNTIITFILSLIVAAIVIFLFIFLLKIIKNKNIHASTVFSTLQDKMTEKERLSIVKEKLQEIESTKESIDRYFLNPEEVDKFVAYLEEIGTINNSKVSINGIEISPKKTSIISFKLSTQGSFQSVMDTVVYLENIPYQIDFTQVYINKKIEQQTDLSQKDASLTISKWQADVSFNILTNK